MYLWYISTVVRFVTYLFSLSTSYRVVLVSLVCSGARHITYLLVGGRWRCCCLCVVCFGLFWGAHKSLAPRARTLLGGLGQATLSFFAVATPLFVFFGECPKFCDLAKQRRKIVGGVSEVGKDDFSLYFLWRCVVFLVFFFFCCDRDVR